MQRPLGKEHSVSIFSNTQTLLRTVSMAQNSAHIRILVKVSQNFPIAPGVVENAWLLTHMTGLVFINMFSSQFRHTFCPPPNEYPYVVDLYLPLRSQWLPKSNFVLNRAIASLNPLVTLSQSPARVGGLTQATTMCPSWSTSVFEVLGVRCQHRAHTKSVLCRAYVPSHLMTLKPCSRYHCKS